MLHLIDDWPIIPQVDHDPIYEWFVYKDFLFVGIKYIERPETILAASNFKICNISVFIVL